jgi:multidrug efflux system outer membrane protein
MSRRLLAPLALACVVAGCAALPLKPPPGPTVAGGARFANDRAEAPAPVDPAWWTGLADPVLDALIARAFLANRDLAAASADVAQARALARLQGWTLLPSIGGNASFTRLKPAGAIPQLGVSGEPLVLDATDLFVVGGSASWEIDIYGRLRAGAKAARAEALSLAAARRGVLVSLAAEVSVAYVSLRGAQARLAAARRNAELQRRTLTLTDTVRAAGRGTRLDVARAREQLATTEAQIPLREAEVAQAIYALGVLAGGGPQDLAEQLAGEGALPSPPPLRGLGDPGDLLARRPDIVAARRLLEAAAFRVGAARVEWWPRVTFQGDVGLQSFALSTLTGPGAFFYSFGTRIDWPLLDVRRNQFRTAAAKAGAAAEFARFDQAVAQGLAEVESALVALDAAERSAARLEEAVTAAREAAELSRLRYREGVEPFFTVLDAEQRLAVAEDNLALARTNAAIAYARLGQALGAGWEAGPSVTGEPAAPARGAARLRG